MQTNVQKSNSSMSRMFTLASFELVRLFLTKRGLLAIGAFSLVWFFILYYPVNYAADLVTTAEFRGAVEQLFGALGLNALLDWPVAELALYWLVAVYTFPLFTIAASSDQTCSDRARGTLRFISLRSTRNEILLGRFLGQVLITSILAILTLVATILLAMWRDTALALPAALLSATLFFNLFIAILPFVALMSFFNSFLNSAKLTIIWTILFFGIGSLVISLLSFKWPEAQYLNYLYPGTQLKHVVSQGSLSFSIYAIPLVQTIAYLALSSILMKRSAI